MSKVLVTGGAGYIGSHTLLSLLNKGYEVVVVDNLSNSSKESILRVEKLTGKVVTFIETDILDKEAMEYVFSKHKIDAVIHFAGLKAVGESVQKPLEYYYNNVQGTMMLLFVMKKFNVNQLVFSSSATVYGEANEPPYKESQPIGNPSSPYGKTKAMVEQILMDYCKANSDFKVANLRYFNPIGADISGEIGEDPNGIPNNLMPFVAQVAVGKRKKLAIFGDDYPTKDGTCLRDYIHVTDLADGHIDALTWLIKQHSGCCEAFNLGTGEPLSVLEIVHGFEKYSKQKVDYEFSPRRDGDLPAFWADATKAKAQLGWQPTKSLEDIMKDTWRWQSKNPNGYPN
ncbi:UDP-glucose 4-epimerase GalE [Shewanella sp. 1_MG-2023]|uniref:UDP-glucose 4-epimerase GalE n=1 Tax=unclassified Shewanella TaxID=196818 RepID=UPI0026E29323|nr:MULTISPECIES: UDP-glucose 4-epimerase GalE [unclassified Shewanella]MDO6612313.1 UDP-glucose 4-epimerase GalE [Shewanella sp. 7_MG-2023]MDO6772167.1 UDP-glucose 4-epimerase GalE [Shewanella sp. 2_MG-2023]MDO6794073.1 UDP-glucose 4-epimerase GalE [Shewanella sp. 1_MG-2023]